MVPDTDVPPSQSQSWSDGNAHRLAAVAAAQIAADSGVARHDVAIILGTGLAGAAQAIGPTRSRHALASVEGMPASFVSHQQSEIRSIDVADHRVLAFLGRLHLYEGYSPARVAHSVRLAVAAGCRSVVITNASGSLRPEVGTGEIVLISDHLNLTGRSPMSGLPAGVDLPSPFVDLVDAWSPRLRGLALGVDPSLVEGVYAQLAGPQFETPAEIRMLRALGADLVGMSSVIEAIAARQLGAEVLGLSLVTNLAAGLDPGGVSAQAIVGVGERRAEDVGQVIREVIVAL